MEPVRDELSAADLDALEHAAYRAAGETLVDGPAVSSDLLTLLAEVRRLDAENALLSDQAAWLDNENARLRAGLARLTAELTEMTQERDAISTVFDAYQGDCDELRAERDELRAVLAPVLDEPIEEVRTAAGWYVRCRFCCLLLGPVDGWGETHTPQCPVLARDRLLGREPT